MVVINQVIVEVLHLVARNLNNGDTSTSGPTPTVAAASTTETTTAATTTLSSNQNINNNNTSQSPLLFFVALGFGVVFTNLWIIVGVKYCFRYNARNRAIARGEDGEPINLETMPRPHRRRREKKLMTMDEVNERFPLTKYKNWTASRARQGLPTAGGVTAPPSRAVSVRDAEGVIPSSPTLAKHSGDDRPATAVSAAETPAVIVTQPTSEEGKASIDGHEKLAAVDNSAPLTTLHEVNTQATVETKDDVSDDEEDHIPTALAPDLLDLPGDQCAICIDTLEADDDIRGLTCGHAFHASCLDPWLTSRRACCPLCKADYYVPKPRPEGEAADTERVRRRMNANMPQPPASAWIGMRGNPRLVFPGRFMTSRMGGPYGIGEAEQRFGVPRPRQERVSTIEPIPVDPERLPSLSYPPQISPFNLRLPNFPNIRFPGRRNQQAAPAAATEATPTPAQLEDGVVR